MSVKRNVNVIARKVHGTYFLIDISDNYSGDKCALYEINQTGMFIWDNINGERTIEQLAILLKDAIVDEVDYQMIYDDVNEFVETLVAKHFVEV